EQWRKAELAFGCILFSEEAFQFLQESVDHAVSMFDAALKTGGHPPLKRPAGRGRDLLPQIDPRALEWYGQERPPALPLREPPPSIQAIPSPETLRRSLDEVWTAANSLQTALDLWQEWFRVLSQRGDAHPAVALTCEEVACQAIKVLCVYRPNLAPF